MRDEGTHKNPVLRIWEASEGIHNNPTPSPENSFARGLGIVLETHHHHYKQIAGHFSLNPSKFLNFRCHFESAVLYLKICLQIRNIDGNVSILSRREKNLEKREIWKPLYFCDIRDIKYAKMNITENYDVTLMTVRKGNTWLCLLIYIQFWKRTWT